MTQPIFRFGWTVRILNKYYIITREFFLREFYGLLMWTRGVAVNKSFWECLGLMFIVQERLKKLLMSVKFFWILLIVKYYVRKSSLKVTHSLLMWYYVRLLGQNSSLVPFLDPFHFEIPENSRYSSWTMLMQYVNMNF